MISATANLIEIGMLERKGERRDGALAQPVHQRNHGARVQARAQPRANGNVTHEVQSNGFCELLAKRLRPLPGAPAPAVRSEVDVPVLVETRVALLIDEVVGRRYPANTREHRSGCSHETPHHQVGERGVVHSPLYGIGRENRFLLRAEVAARGRKCIMKRLDPESIPRQHEPLPLSIPKREAEHATQMPHALDPEILVEMHDDFNIGMRVETMTARDELVTESGVVVDLTVAHHGDGSVFARDRLVTRLQVDDAQPRHPQPDPR